MYKSVLKAALCIGVLHATVATADTDSEEGQKIIRAGEQASIAGPEQFFTGRVRIDPIWAADKHLNTSGAQVTFEPGARSAWHTHPAGQRLVVTSGVGMTQEWGKPIQIIQPGDVVWCPPGVKHWHGATPTTAMSHIAVTATLEDKNVNWMEKVSDEQYGHTPKN